MIPQLRPVIAAPLPMSLLRRILFVAVVLPVGAAAMAQTHCDPSLAPSTNHPYGYVERGDRCEGVYIQAVGGTTLALLSFTASLGEIDIVSGRPLLLEWPAHPAIATCSCVRSRCSGGYSIAWTQAFAPAARATGGRPTGSLR